MKQGLSKREKILLFSAGMLILIYVAVQFAIYPLIIRYTDNVSERDSLRLEKRLTESDIANKAAVQYANTEANAGFTQIKDNYPLLVPNEEIDPILTNLCLKNNLRPASLRFTGSVRAPQSDDTDREPTFTIITVSMTVSGNFSSILQLLDDVDSMQYIRITNLSYSANRQSNASENDSMISLIFELTFVNP